MKPTKEQLEALAEKHCFNTQECTVDYDNSHVGYNFLLSQLDAYFNERLKMVFGEPVAWYWADGKGLVCSMEKPDLEIIAPLYAIKEV